MTTEIMQWLLALFLAAMFVLAMLSLRRRELIWHEYTAWVLLALLVPLLGPFIVILARPGERKKQAQAATIRPRRLKP